MADSIPGVEERFVRAEARVLGSAAATGARAVDAWATLMPVGVLPLLVNRLMLAEDRNQR